jgi:transposase-like protein
MKYRKWDAKTKASIVFDYLEHKMPAAELCNKYQIRQSLLSYWLKEFQGKAHKAFDNVQQTKKERRLADENKKLKRIIAELTIELKKTELELGEGDGL